MKKGTAILLMAFASVNSPESAQGEPPTAVGSELTVLTLNLAKIADPSVILAELHSNEALTSADLLLLQEVKQNDGQEQCVAEQIATHLGMHVAYSPAETGVTDQGLAILSRFPLREIKTRELKKYDLRYRSRSRIVLAATADTTRGPVRILNTHLDTRLNMQQRLQQLRPILVDEPAFSGPRIVGGDFNTNAFYWVAHVLPFPSFRSQGFGLHEFMTANGYRTPVPVAASTHDFLGMHLDWIWVRGLEPRGYNIYPLRFSDHHAVLARIQLPVQP